jgi:hypothetical protein
MKLRSWLGLSAAAAALIIDGLYVAIIVTQGTPIELGRVGVVAFLLLALAIAAAVGALTKRRRLAIGLSLAAGLGLVALGAVAILSIGLLFIIAGIPAIAGAVMAYESPPIL